MRFFWKKSSGICFYWYIVYIKTKITRSIFTSQNVFNSLFKRENTGPKLWACEILCSYIQWCDKSIMHKNNNRKININIGRFYYDKSTKTLYRYSHDRLEIKDIRCIHQGIERKKKRKKEGWQPFCFAECVDIKLEEVVQLI